jgi:hypothetical protein
MKITADRNNDHIEHERFNKFADRWHVERAHNVTPHFR